MLQQTVEFFFLSIVHIFSLIIVLENETGHRRRTPRTRAMQITNLTISMQRQPIRKHVQLDMIRCLIHEHSAAPSGWRNILVHRLSHTSKVGSTQITDIVVPSRSSKSSFHDLPTVPHQIQKQFMENHNQLQSMRPRNWF